MKVRYSEIRGITRSMHGWCRKTKKAKKREGKKDWKSARDSTRSQDPYAIPGLEIRETASRATPFSFGVSARATTGTWCREIKFNGVSLDEHRSPSAYEHVFVNATTEQAIPRNWKFNRTPCFFFDRCRQPERPARPFVFSLHSTNTSCNYFSTHRWHSRLLCLP